MTLDMAKEISMIQRNEKGKQARQYFIQIEKAWNSPEMIMKRALQIADRKIIDLQTALNRTSQKRIFADAVAASDTSILVGDLAKLLNQNGIPTGANCLFKLDASRTDHLIKRKGADYNMPTQRSADMETVFRRSKKRLLVILTGPSKSARRQRSLAKGSSIFINLFMKNKEMEG